MLIRVNLLVLTIQFIVLVSTFVDDDLFLMSAQIIPDSPNRQTVTDRILTDDRVEGLRWRGRV